MLGVLAFTSSTEGFEGCDYSLIASTRLAADYLIHRAGVLAMADAVGSGLRKLALSDVPLADVPLAGLVGEVVVGEVVCVHCCE